MSGAMCSGATPTAGEGGDSFQQGTKLCVQWRVLGVHGNTGSRDAHESVCVCKLTAGFVYRKTSRRSVVFTGRRGRGRAEGVKSCGGVKLSHV